MDDGQDGIEIERPVRLFLNESAEREIADWLKGHGWDEIERFRASPLFSEPMAHCSFVS